MFRLKFGILYDVARLRTIMLAACDWNNNNKWLGRKAMRHAEKYGMIANEQYGSRKGHRAIGNRYQSPTWIDSSSSWRVDEGGMSGFVEYSIR